MRTSLIIASGIVVAGAIWVLLGSRISLLAGCCFTGPRTMLAASPLWIDGESFALGPRKWPLPRAGPFAVKVSVDARHRVTIEIGRRVFPLGPVREMSGGPEPQYLFVPEAGDTVRFTRETGRLAWWTPFAFSMLGAETPSWHRYVYDRLRWTKASGEELEMVWRDEQSRFRTGWMDAYANRLTAVTIRPR